MPASSEFWDKRARKYAASPVKDMAAFDETMERTLAHLSAEDSVLELGCGTGPTALRLAPHVARYRATDLSPEMIQIARERLAESPCPNLSFDVAKEDSAGDTHDAVLAFNLLHLLDDVPGALKRIHARLKPGGRFISKSGCLSEAPLPIRLLLPLMKLIGIAPFVNGFSATELQQMITEAGFEILEAKTFAGMAPARFIVARKTSA